jgi:hypothetical protein
LLDENDDKDRIMKAEIFRELGEFDKSVALLDHDFAGRLSTVGVFIKGLCEKKDTHVREIPRNAEEVKRPTAP